MEKTKNNTQNMEYEYLTEKEKDNIKNYLSSRLGKYCLDWYDIKWEKTPRYNFKEIGMVRLDKTALGMFEFTIKEARLEISVWENRYITLSIDYQHHDGGTNGHRMSLRLKLVNEKVVEV